MQSHAHQKHAISRRQMELLWYVTASGALMACFVVYSKAYISTAHTRTCAADLWDTYRKEANLRDQAWIEEIRSEMPPGIGVLMLIPSDKAILDTLDSKEAFDDALAEDGTIAGRIFWYHIVLYNHPSTPTNTTGQPTGWDLIMLLRGSREERQASGVQNITLDTVARIFGGPEEESQLTFRMNGTYVQVVGAENTANLKFDPNLIGCGSFFTFSVDRMLLPKGTRQYADASWPAAPAPRVAASAPRVAASAPRVAASAPRVAAPAPQVAAPAPQPFAQSSLQTEPAPAPQPLAPQPLAQAPQSLVPQPLAPAPQPLAPQPSAPAPQPLAPQPFAPQPFVQASVPIAPEPQPLAPASRQLAPVSSPPPPPSSSSNTAAIVGGVVGGVVALTLLVLAGVFVRRRTQRHAILANAASKRDSGSGSGSVADSITVDKNNSVKDDLGQRGSDSVVYNPFYSASLSMDSSGTPITGQSSTSGSQSVLFVRNPSYKDTDSMHRPWASRQGTGPIPVTDVLTAQTINEYSDNVCMIDEHMLLLPNPPRILGKGGFGEVYAAKLNNQWVAVKAMKGGTAGDMKSLALCMQSVLNEVKTLLNCNSPYLVRCVGITNAWPFKMLYELCEGGDLYSKLSGDQREEWMWNRRGKQVALDMCLGLKYLHEQANMVHSDIKSPNVLLTANGRAKLGDFGLMRLLSHQEEVQQASKVICSRASFGVVLMELLLGEPVDRPYPTITVDDDRFPSEIVELMHQCISDDPTKRPRIGQVYDTLLRHV